MQTFFPLILIFLFNVCLAQNQVEIDPWVVFDYEILIFDKEAEEPIEDVFVFTNCSNSKLIQSNVSGKAIVTFERGSNCWFIFEKEGYKTVRIAINAADLIPKRACDWKIVQILMERK